MSDRLVQHTLTHKWRGKMRLFYRGWDCKTNRRFCSFLYISNQRFRCAKKYCGEMNYFFRGSIVVRSNWTRFDGQYRLIFDICRFWTVDVACSSAAASIERFFFLFAAKSGFDASNIGWRIRRRALINQLFTCNKERFVFWEIARFSSSVGYGWT